VRWPRSPGSCLPLPKPHPSSHEYDKHLAIVSPVPSCASGAPASKFVAANWLCERRTEHHQQLAWPRSHPTPASWATSPLTSPRSSCTSCFRVRPGPGVHPARCAHSRACAPVFFPFPYTMTVMHRHGLRAPAPVPAHGWFSPPARGRGDTVIVSGPGRDGPGRGAAYPSLSFGLPQQQPQAHSIPGTPTHPPLAAPVGPHALFLLTFIAPF
jgi:hypothetical protein